MGQQISIDDALAAFREQHGKLADENVLLRAQVTGLEREVGTLREENGRLLAAAQQTTVSETDPPPSAYDEPR